MKKFKVTVDGQAYSVQVEEVGETQEGKVSSQKVENIVRAEPTPQPAAVKKEEPPVNNVQKPPSPAEDGSGFSVKAPMPGSVLEVKVKVGDTVNDGDVLLVLEAMKMENELTASQSGTVTEISVKKGDTVNSGDPLVVLS